MEHWEISPLNMTPAEQNALSRTKEEICKCIDPIAFVAELDTSGCVTGELKSQIYKMFENDIPRDQICSFLLGYIEKQTSLQRVIQCLFRCRHQTLASKLFLDFIDVSWEKIQEICGGVACCVVYPCVLLMAREASTSTHPYQKLRSFAVAPLRNLNIGADIKQKELCVKTLMDIQGMITIPKILEVSPLFSDFYQKIKNLPGMSTGEPAANVECYNEMANIANEVGEYAVAEQMQLSAKSVKYVNARLLECMNLLLIEVCVQFRQLEESNNADIKEEILLWSHIGLHISEQEGYQLNEWQILFIMQILSCLFGINLNGNLYASNINKETVGDANLLLCQLDKFLNNMTKRQKILYYFMKSRLYECSNDLEIALTYISKAICMQNTDYTVAELVKNIQGHEKILQQKLGDCNTADHESRVSLMDRCEQTNNGCSRTCFHYHEKRTMVRYKEIKSGQMPRHDVPEKPTLDRLERKACGDGRRYQSKHIGKNNINVYQEVRRTYSPRDISQAPDFLSQIRLNRLKSGSAAEILKENELQTTEGLHSTDDTENQLRLMELKSQTSQNEESEIKTLNMGENQDNIQKDSFFEVDHLHQNVLEYDEIRSEYYQKNDSYLSETELLKVEGIQISNYKSANCSIQQPFAHSNVRAFEASKLDVPSAVKDSVHINIQNYCLFNETRKMNGNVSPSTDQCGNIRPENKTYCKEVTREKKLNNFTEHSQMNACVGFGMFSGRSDDDMYICEKEPVKSITKIKDLVTEHFNLSERGVPDGASFP